VINKRRNYLLKAHSLIKPMLSIQLHDLEFFAHHGLYESEKINGNHFLVDVNISIDVHEQIVSLNQTVDYVKVYQIISERMKIATPLLETLAQEMATSIYMADKIIKYIEINIKNLTPPIPDFKGTVGIQIKQLY
jgi:dihydroneopterin aldolase